MNLMSGDVTKRVTLIVAYGTLKVENKKEGDTRSGLWVTLKVEKKEECDTKSGLWVYFFFFFLEVSFEA